MPYVFSRSAASLLAVSASVCVLSCGQAFANGKTNASQVAKYFNPFQKKGYLNQSQDRIIKKKSFKSGQLPVSEAVTNKELGYFAILPADKLTDADYVANLLTNKRVNGLSALVPWSMIEPSQDQFDWHVVDNLLTACEKSGKTLILRITTCGVDLPDTADAKQLTADTPKWVFDAGVKSIAFTDPNGKVHTMPIFWDKDYLANWSNFVSEFAERYDKNPNIQSIGITGGGFGAGTQVVPDYQAQSASKTAKGGSADLADVLKTEHGMTQRQLVEHWKYVADIFPKRFQNARLNFAINAPTHNRAGEDALDEIADYLAYRYGGRVYLTRHGINNGKHGFDDYRLLLKFHNDTLTGLRLTDDVTPDVMAKITKRSLDDGISYAEMPVALLTSTDPAAQAALDMLAQHIGFQIIEQKATLTEKISVGQPLKASFSFVNVGAASAMRPERNFDKDVPSSFRLQIELRDADGKPVLQNLHTPPTPTNLWTSGRPVTWDEELKMVDQDKRQLPPGEYSAWMSLVDPVGKRKIVFLNATSGAKPTSAETVEVGKVTITPAVASQKIETSANDGQQR